MLERWREQRRAAKAVREARARRQAVIAAVRADVARAEQSRLMPAATAAIVELLDDPITRPLWQRLPQPRREALTRLRAGLLDGWLDHVTAEQLFVDLDWSEDLPHEAVDTLEAIENWMGGLEEPSDPGLPESALWLVVVEHSHHDGDAADILTAPRTAAALARVRRHLGLV